MYNHSKEDSKESPCEFCSELHKLPWRGIGEEFDKIAMILEMRPIVRTPAEHMIIENLISLTKLVVKILAEQTPTNKELYGCTDQCRNSKEHEHTVTLEMVDKLRRGSANSLDYWQKAGCPRPSESRLHFENLQEETHVALKIYRQENGI